MTNHTRTPRLLLLLATVAAAGGYIQVAAQNVFWCGRTEAFPGTEVLAILGLAQSALYLAAAAAPAWQRPYRLSQYAVLPFIATGLWQVFSPYPGTTLLFAGLFALPALYLRSIAPDLIGLFAVAALGFLAAFGQIPFTLPGRTVPDWQITLAGTAALAVALPITLSARPVAAGLRHAIPLTLPLFAILRAKLPDTAYDSLSYKTTIPYQLAEWRTGDTALIDGYMVGTNLQEMLNALLVALTRDWLPPFISTTSFILLALIVPLAFPIGRLATPAQRAIAAFAALSAFTLTEAAAAQGTAYQEPLLLLFLVAALIRMPAWPAFLAMAIAVKINAAFIAPLIVLYHRPFRTRHLLTGILAAALVLTPQLNRNVIFSGRLLGMSELAATVTDPPGPHQVMTQGATRYDAKVRGGLLNNALQGACNIWLLDGLCSIKFNGNTEAGFNVFPASRTPLFAIIFSIGAVLMPAAVRGRRLPVMAGAIYAICITGFLGFLAEGRYVLPISLGFSVLLLINRSPAETIARSVPPWLAVALGCLLIGSDLLPGTFTNASWICKRELTTPATLPDLRSPETPVQRFLADTVTRYKQACPPPGLPPVILSENDKLNSPYLGTQRIFHVYTQAMIARFLAADPARQREAASAIIAVASEHPDYAATLLGPAAADFAPCFDDGGLHVACSTRLAPLGSQCAESLYFNR